VRLIITKTAALRVNLKSSAMATSFTPAEPLAYLEILILTAFAPTSPTRFPSPAPLRA